MKPNTHHLILILLLASNWVAAELPKEATGIRPNAAGDATEVMVAPFLIDVSKVSGADQSFTADFFVLMSWQDPRLAGAFDVTQRVPLEAVWNPRIQILNQRELKTTFPDQADVSPDGTVVTRQRYFGTFSAPLDLHDFPLDNQLFFIRLVAPGYSPEEVRFTPHPENPADAGRSSEFSITDWTIGPPVSREESFEVIPGGRHISGYLVSFDGHRHIGFWAGKAFVSVAIIVAMSWVVFWIDPKFVAPRLSVAVTSMLTLIAYRFLLGSVLPGLSYLTRMDYFLLGSTLLVFITVIQVAATTHAEDRDHGAKARRINARSRWVFPGAFVALMAITLWLI